MSHFLFFNDTATAEIYTLSLHDALPIFTPIAIQLPSRSARPSIRTSASTAIPPSGVYFTAFERRLLRICRTRRSEEHTSELQSRQYLVCRLLLEQKNMQFTQIFGIPGSP